MLLLVTLNTMDSKESGQILGLSLFNQWRTPFPSPWLHGPSYLWKALSSMPWLFKCGSLKHSFTSFINYSSHLILSLMLVQWPGTKFQCPQRLLMEKKTLSLRTCWVVWSWFVKFVCSPFCLNRFPVGVHFLPQSREILKWRQNFPWCDCEWLSPL